MKRPIKIPYATLLHWYEKDKEELQEKTIGAEFLPSKNI